MLRPLPLAFLLLAMMSSPAQAKKKRVDRLAGVSVLGIRIAFDTFKTVQEKLGPAAMRRIAEHEDVPAYLCYRTQSGQSWFWFESGPGGGWETIDNIVIATHPRRADEQCTLVPDDADEKGVGKLKLRLSQREVSRLLGPRACQDRRCELTEARETQPPGAEKPFTLTLSVIVELKAGVVDSITLWRNEKS